MNAQRFAVVLLVLLVVLFAVGVSLGVGRSGSAGEPGWATFVQRSFVREERVLPREVRGPCVSGGKVAVLRGGAPCTVTIGPRDDALIRKATFELADGLKVKGSFKPGGEAAGPVSITLQTRVRTLELPIVKEGAVLDLECVAANPLTMGCTVTVR
jgi:hypothetical protein